MRPAVKSARFLRRVFQSGLLVAVIGLLGGAPAGAAEPTEPVFVYRTLQRVFRKEPGNTPEKAAEVMRQVVPEDIRPWTVVSLELSPAGYNYLDGDTPLEFCRRFDKLGYRFTIEIADPLIPDLPTRRRSFTPAEIAEILDACPNCLGPETGETFWAFTGGDNAKMDDWLLAVLRVCAERHRRFILGEGTWNRGHWTRFLHRHHEALRTEGLGRSLVPLHKNTKPWATFENVGALQGAWVTGLVPDYGLWNDKWVWTYASFGHAGQFPPYDKKDQNVRKMPYVFFLRQWLWAISQGARYSFTEDPMAFSREGVANPNFSKYLRPFIRGIGEHRITPSREAVLAKMRVVVDPFGVYETGRGRWEYDPRQVFFTYLDAPTAFAPKSYDPFTVLFRNTYGFTPEYDGTTAAGRMFPRESSLPDRLTREIMPNSSRYYAVPILAHPAEEIPAGLRRLRLAELRTDATVRGAFDSLYPPEAPGNQAYAVEVDGSFFILSGSENRDADQHFRLPLGTGAFTQMEGDLPFQNLVFGKREGPDRFWFQANGYSGDGKTEGQRYVAQAHPTVITFTCAVAPEIRAEPGHEKRLGILRPWDPATRAVTVSCDHADGAVNFTVTRAR